MRAAKYICFCALAIAGASFDAHAIESERVRRGGESVESNWHVGPFFEYKKSAPGDATFWAVRPFYSQVRDSSTDTAVTDAVWPLFTSHEHAGASWWNTFIIVYGDDRKNDPSHSFNVFPFWFSGADRSGEEYWGLFPFYGRHPHILLLDDFSFVCWPFWHTYEVKGVRSRAVCWPFVTWRESPREGLGVWPFYGEARLRESRHNYALWPFVTWARYDEDRDTSGAGTSWWLLPFYGEVRRARESQTMVLPPFFSYAQTDHAKRLRLPWPFVELETSAKRDRISIWPVWEQLRGFAYASRKEEERTWRFGWKLLENTELETDRILEKRLNFFPFLTLERMWKKGTGTVPVNSYVRIWPLWSRENVNGRVRCRTLDLVPIRHVEAIERNWAPFWSLYEREDLPGGRSRHSFLFNIFNWETGE